MLGIMLQGIGTFFEEISGSLGKAIVSKRSSALYVLGFLNAGLAFMISVTYLLLGHGEFVLLRQSLPSLAFLVVINMAQAYATMVATAKSSRSTFNFIRTGTMPLLLLVDLVLGYAVSGRQMSGIALIFAALLLLFVNHGIERGGLGVVIFSTVNAVVTISIYKWHLSLGNSVPAEQMVLQLGVAMFFLVGTVRTRDNAALTLLNSKKTWAQTFSYAFGSFVEGFAYQFAAASVILAAKRSFAVLWGIVAGNRLFAEQGLKVKLAAFAVISAGISLLTMA